MEDATMEVDEGGTDSVEEGVEEGVEERVAGRSL